MDQKPLVSVIIPSYNCGRYVAAAVDSALAQTYRPLEVIVVDDGSTDDTPQQLARFEGRICYIRQANRGISQARNRGIDEAQGSLIAFLDADDQWLPEKLERQVARLGNDPRTALVHCDLKFLNESSGQQFYVDRKRDRFQGACYDLLFFGNNVIPSAVVVRRECLEAVGGFDEIAPIEGCEDYDLWLRLARYYEFAYEPAALTIYRLHGNNMSGNRLKIARGVLAVVEKSLFNDLELPRRVGPRRARARQFELSMDVGYLYFDRQELAAARPYLSAAVWLRRSSGYAWALWLATFLPHGLVCGIRSFKQGLRKIINRLRSSQPGTENLALGGEVSP